MLYLALCEEPVSTSRTQSTIIGLIRIKKIQTQSAELTLNCIVKRCYNKWILTSRNMFATVAILLFVQLVTPASGTNQDYNAQVSQNGRIQTPDEFLEAIFPHNNIEDVWQAIMGSQEAAQARPGVRVQKGRQDQRSMPLELQTKTDREILLEQALDVMCGTPRSVIIDAYKEIGIVEGLVFRLYPECIRVNRCRNSGCCADGFTCKANQTELVKKQFMVYDTDARQPVVHSVQRNVVNHKTCSCVQKSSCTKTMACLSTHIWNLTTCMCECATRCPSPYVQDRSSCACGCPSGNNQCVKITKGLIKLPKEQCRLLEDNNMSFPPCDRDKTFYPECCRCLKRPCEKVSTQKLRNMPSVQSPLGNIPNNNQPYSSSYSVSIISKIGEASFRSNKKNHKYKITRHNQDQSSSDNSSED